MEDVRAEGRPVVRVVVKVRFAPFFTKQHGVKLGNPTRDEKEIQMGASAALGKFELTRPIRLLGVRAEFAQLSNGEGSF
jgi:DNA polymerase-4